MKTANQTFDLFAPRPSRSLFPSAVTPSVAMAHAEKVKESQACEPAPVVAIEKARALDDGKRTVKSEIYVILANSSRWWSLPELAKELERRGLQSLETSVSARIRELAKTYHCSVRSRIREGSSHLWEYAIGFEGVAP